MTAKWLFVAIVFSLQATAATISVRADLWCPYTCEPGSDHPGFMIEIAQEIFQKNGDVIDYQLMNWARAVAETKQGKYNAVVGANRGDVPGFILPKNSQGLSINYFWAKKDSTFSYQSIDSIKDKKIGVINSYSYGGDELDIPIKDHHPSFVILPGDDALTKLVKMTEAGRLDAFVENPYVLQNLLKKDLKQFENTLKPVSKNMATDPELFIAFSPAKSRVGESKKYAKILSDGIVSLRKSGRLKIILDKYEIKDWKK
jgi:polar amino acid transport system substrate-binding protein